MLYGGQPIDIAMLCEEWGATIFHKVICETIRMGSDIELTNPCEEWGAEFVARVVLLAAIEGSVESGELEEWGAALFCDAMRQAVCGGRGVELANLCEEWGATDFDGAMPRAACGGHIDLVKLCKEREQRILTRQCMKQTMEVTSRSSSCVEVG